MQRKLGYVASGLFLSDSDISFIFSNILFLNVSFTISDVSLGYFHATSQGWPKKLALQDLDMTPKLSIKTRT